MRHLPWIPQVRTADIPLYTPSPGTPTYEALRARARMLRLYYSVSVAGSYEYALNEWTGRPVWDPMDFIFWYPGWGQCWLNTFPGSTERLWVDPFGMPLRDTTW